MSTLEDWLNKIDTSLRNHKDEVLNDARTSPQNTDELVVQERINKIFENLSNTIKKEQNYDTLSVEDQKKFNIACQGARYLHVLRNNVRKILEKNPDEPLPPNAIKG